jgi:hypothetical protein
MNKLKFVKFLVLFLTMLIIFGMIAAGFEIYKKSRSSVSPSDMLLNLEQPKGSYIEETIINNETMYLLIKGGNLSDRIVSIDLSKYVVLSSITIN